MDKYGINRIDKIVTIIVRVLLLVAVAFEIFRGFWLTLFTAVAGFALTFLPEILEKQKGIYLPKTLQIVYTLFIYGSIGLGEQNNFYEIFPWWDILLHFTSGVIFGILGFALVYFINEKSVSMKLSPFFICAFAFTFVVTMGVFWEIFEFSMDQYLGFNMQKWLEGGIRAGLVDTMQDLIVDTIGAFIVTVPAFLIMKKDKKKFFKSIKDGFMSDEANEFDSKGDKKK